MKKTVAAALAVAGVALSAGEGLAQAGVSGVCDRETVAAKAKVQEEHKRWVDGITKGEFPPAIRDAYLVVLGYTRDASLHAADAQNVQCTNKYTSAQAAMNTAMAVFSRGLSLLAPGKSAYVDVSEIMNGYPLGGPDALVPKLREQILQGDNGTLANVLRDPWNCIIGNRAC